MSAELHVPKPRPYFHFALRHLPPDAPPLPLPPPPPPPENSFPTPTELLQDLAAQDDHSADRHKKRVKRRRAAQEAVARGLGYMPTDPDSLSSHDKKRLYLDCLEQYVVHLHNYVLASGFQPIPIERVSSGRGLTSRSIRTLLVHLQNEASILHHERHEADARLRDMHAFYRQQLAAFPAGSGVDYPDATSASRQSPLCQQPGPPPLTLDSSAVAIAVSAPVPATDYVQPPAASMTTYFGSQGAYAYAPAPQVQVSDAYSNLHSYSALPSDLASAANTSAPSMSPPASSDSSTPTLTPSSAHPSSALPHSSFPSFAPGPAFGSANDYGSNQQLQAQRRHSIATTTVPDSPAVEAYAYSYPVDHYQPHLLAPTPYQHPGSSCTPGGPPPAAGEFSPLSPAGTYYLTDAAVGNGNGGHDGHDGYHSPALYAGYDGQQQYTASGVVVPADSHGTSSTSIMNGSGHEGGYLSNFNTNDHVRRGMPLQPLVVPSNASPLTPVGSGSNGMDGHGQGHAQIDVNMSSASIPPLIVPSNASPLQVVGGHGMHVSPMQHTHTHSPVHPYDGRVSTPSTMSVYPQQGYQFP